MSELPDIDARRAYLREFIPDEVNERMSRFLDEPRFVNRQGEAIDFREFMALFADLAYFTVAVTTLPDGREVATVWLGDTAAGNLPFETMTVTLDGVKRFWRWGDEDLAREGHDYVVGLATRDGVEPTGGWE
jgi:hypothetical protein